MNNHKIKKTISNGFFDNLNIHNTLDCINGIKIDLTSSDKNFEYAEALCTITSVVEILNKSLNRKQKPKVFSKIPSKEEIQSSNLFSVFSIGVNYPSQNTLKMNRSKVHIHAFVYGVHNFRKEIEQFLFDVDNGIKRQKYFKTKNRHSLFIKPVTDELDSAIRAKSSIGPLIEYIVNPKPGTWMNYQKNVNSNQLLYYL